MDWLNKHEFERKTGDASAFALKAIGKVRMTIVVHVGDLRIAGSIEDRLWLIEELKKESSLKLVEHLEKEGDQANFVRKIVTRCLKGYTVGASREHVKCSVESLDFDVDKTKPASTPGLSQSLRSNENK